MRVFGFFGALVAGVLLWPGLATAEDVALILGDRGQIGAFQDPSGADANAFRVPLAQAGFQVVEPHNRNMFHMRLTAQSVETAIEAGEVDRLVIVLLGPFAHDGRDSWILANEAVGATRLTVGTAGFSMSALTGLAARSGIQSTILASPGAMPLDLGHGLFEGLGDYDKDGRVTYITGPSRSLAGVLQGSLLQDGMSFGAAARSAPRGVVIEGNLSESVGLMGPVYLGNPSGSEEQGFWKAVQMLDTKTAYRTYLKEYPGGLYSAEAKARIAYLKEEPERQAKAAEEALNLSRDARRQIQRNLSLLGFDPRGIDGVFGRGSRMAIAAWQRDNSFPETGFITGNQLLQLRDQAREEAERQEAEAEQRRIEEERKDRAYWRSTGRRGDEAGLREYLERYPDGLFSDIAQARLDAIEEDRLAEAAREERDAWDAARQADTIEAYQEFLNAYPQSGFAEAAGARLSELNDQRQNAQLIEQAKAEEAQLARTEVARVVIEQRLARLGADPGKVDGKFTKQTRKAIRRFQRARRLPVTGYVSRNTMVRLMAGG